MIKKEIKVAIALISHRGKILVGWRDEHLHQGGCHEFPGGKVESYESPEQAVKREVQEEVGVSIRETQLFEEIHHQYSDRHVHLYVYICYLDHSNLQDIQMPWQWQSLESLSTLTFPAANQSIIDRLNWPHYLCITAADRSSEKCAGPTSDLVYLRKKYTHMTQCIEDISTFDQHIRLILNAEYYQQLPSHLQSRIFAIHLRQDQTHLIQIYQKTKNIIMACHSPIELKIAQESGVHAALYSPVLSTPTHPERLGMGWDTFQQSVSEFDLPIYALGGMKRTDLNVAQQHGAYGIAGIRDFWSD